MPLRRSQIQGRDAAELGFLWATGIEDTFITEPWAATGRTLDEYELTGHYARWRQDLNLMGSLGVRTARYGIPWHRICPDSGTWDWRWADEPLNYLLELGIDPIVDLVHYGTPRWIDGAFASPEYPAAVAVFARRVAERFAGRIHCYTPLNEPRITAWYCGRLGWWPPHLHGERGFMRVMEGVCRGIVRTTEALRAVDPEIVIVHVDATDLYDAATPDLTASAAHRQNIVFLALDLILGRLNHAHPLWDWCRRALGSNERALHWFLDHPVEIDILGVNLYPMFSQKVLQRTRLRPPLGASSLIAEMEADGTGLGAARIRMPYAGAEIIDRLVSLYYERYRLPIMVTETASNGSVGRRMLWLSDCVQAVRRCRSLGLPLIGYTWWPMFALVAWAYRQGNRVPSAYLAQMGLWDLIADQRIGDNEEHVDGLIRVETALVAQYRSLALAAGDAAGPLFRNGASEAQPLSLSSSR